MVRGDAPVWKGQAQRSWASVTVAGRGNGEAESARGSSESDRLPDRLGWIGLMVSLWVKPISLRLLAKDPGLCLTGTRARARHVEMDTRQKDKEKEKEKDMNPGDRTPKDLNWIMVKLRNRDDSSRGRMCGVWVDSSAGASGHVEADGNNMSQVLPTRVGLVNNETGLPMEPIIPTEVRVEDAEHQQELRHEEKAESSHAGDRAGLTIGATNGKADQGEVAEPSMNDVLEAVKLMGTQMLALTQAFTPLGQAQRSWASVTVAGRGNGEAESARGSSEFERLLDRLRWLGLMVSPWVKPISRARRVEMDIRQKDKEKEKEKDMNPGDRTPKVGDMVTLNLGLGRFRNDVIGLWPDLTMIGYTMGRSDGLDRFRCKPLVGIIGNGLDLTWIVVKLRNRDDSSRGRMCGVWVDLCRNKLMIAYCAN
ncbi:hypothetical protein DY000_02021435 [Brassica cretica]|uniref:DUF4283 domain-containing protein n=1 Tax=Brassica cretica TaxID=69181 RepID=A0ABQ7EC90_BRACR|nr:hypothetical protein DY000_02021435 [Brassica cretica]